MSQERKDLIRSLGAEVRLVSREEGGFLGAIRMAADHGAQGGKHRIQGISDELIPPIVDLPALDPSSVVVTVLPDDNKMYLSTDLLRDESVRPEFLAPRVSGPVTRSRPSRPGAGPFSS